MSNVVEKRSYFRRIDPGVGRWLRLLVNLLLRITVKWRQGLNIDIAAQRRQIDKLNRLAVGKDLGLRREPVRTDGLSAEWLIPDDAEFGRVLLYIHGGAFIARSPDAHAAMVAPWCRSLNARALMVDYRLAPEHPHPAALDDCHRAYLWLLDQGIDARNIVIAGDSAGGNLALSTLLRLNYAGMPLPVCSVLIAPFLDMTLSGRSAVANSRRDSVFTLAFGLGIRHFYAQPAEFLNPEVSPLFGDYAGLPPMLIQVGSTEMLLDDATRAAERAQAAGVAIQLEVWESLPHVFQMIDGLPQARLAAQSILEFVGQHTGWPSNSPQTQAGAPIWTSP